MRRKKLEGTGHDPAFAWRLRRAENLEIQSTHTYWPSGGGSGSCGVQEEEEEETQEEEEDSAICSYCNDHFFSYCTTQLVMSVYEINVLGLSLYPTTEHKLFCITTFLYLLERFMIIWLHLLCRINIYVLSKFLLGTAYNAYTMYEKFNTLYFV